MITFDAILQNNPTEKDAIDYARGLVWGEVETSEQDIKYKNYIDTIDGIEVWYDFGADYYFFAPVPE
jgi:hypothetical protein